MSTGGWIILIIVIVVLALAVGWYVMRNSSKSAQRSKAQELRDEAGERATVVEQQEAKARETAARAQEAQAEADRRTAEAERLQSVAGQQESRTAEARSEVDEQMQRADQIDPDVETEPTSAEAGETPSSEVPRTETETTSSFGETPTRTDTPPESSTEQRRPE